MRTLLVWKLLLAAWICAASQVAVASGFPECRDDECTEVKQHLLKNVFLPLVQLGRLTDEAEIERIVRELNYSYTRKTKDDTGRITWKYPRRAFDEARLQIGKSLRIDISTELICIRRAEVEDVFKEPWLVQKTPARWRIVDRRGDSNSQHNGSMSFREEQPYRFVFVFQPSGCSRAFSIFSE